MSLSSGTEPVRLAHYVIEPEGCLIEKPPIIFIHGVTRSKECWNDITEKVAKTTKRKVYAVDLRNHGDSEWRDGEIECYPADLMHFLDTIKAPKVVLVGHSLGGDVAMQTAWKASERVEKIVVVDNTVSPVPNAICGSILLLMSLNQAAIQQLPSGLSEDAAKEFIAEFVYKEIPQEIKSFIDKPIKEHYDGKLKPTEDGRYTFKTNMIAMQKAIQKYKMRKTVTVGCYDGPTCFIYGKQSPFLVASDEEAIKKCFPNAELVGIENATHIVHEDCPQEFTEALLEFLSKE